MPRLREVKDIAMASADVQAGINAPFLTGPYQTPITYTVLDTTAVAPAIKGKFVVLDISSAANAQPGCNFKQSAAANGLVGRGGGGVVIDPGTSLTLNQAVIVIEGPCQALATSTANTNKPINVGDPLCLDGAGNVTSAPATPAAGTVIGIAAQALAGATGTPTLINIIVGGY